MNGPNPRPDAHPNTHAPTFFSLGYRCSCAGLLKRMGLKHESYPFDWMVSRLPIITHCNETNFQEFTKESNYTNANAATYHYITKKYPNESQIKKEQYICDEKFIYNTYYESYFNKETKSIFIPYPISAPKDAYGYNMLMNHKNILQQENKEYYERCIVRWNELLESTNEKIGIYIHPIMCYEKYNTQQFQIREMITEFHMNMQTQTENYRGIYVIPIRYLQEELYLYTDTFANIENYDAHNIIPLPKIPFAGRITGIKTTPNTLPPETSTIYKSEYLENMYLFTLYTNEDFIDAGEIFMGQCEKETRLIEEIIQRIGNKESIAYSTRIYPR